MVRSTAHQLGRRDSINAPSLFRLASDNRKIGATYLPRRSKPAKSKLGGVDDEADQYLGRAERGTIVTKRDLCQL
jgi:hypothetical protein